MPVCHYSFYIFTNPRPKFTSYVAAIMNNVFSAAYKILCIAPINSHSADSINITSKINSLSLVSNYII